MIAYFVTGYLGIILFWQIYQNVIIHDKLIVLKNDININNIICKNQKVSVFKKLNQPKLRRNAKRGWRRIPEGDLLVIMPQTNVGTFISECV